MGRNYKNEEPACNGKFLNGAGPHINRSCAADENNQNSTIGGVRHKTQLIGTSGLV